LFSLLKFLNFRFTGHSSSLLILDASLEILT
jgi:hypothetical protein